MPHNDPAKNRADKELIVDGTDRRRVPPPEFSLDPSLPEPERPPEIPRDHLDQDALKVILRLRHMRHQAHLVGGCVRDLLLDRIPKDFDVATDAHPGEVRAIFRNCRLIGRRFRLAHVYFRGGKVVEVATFRKNPVDVGDDVPDNSDLLITRDNVFGTAEEDAVRRDFTVNGLFYDVVTGEVIDYVGGREDLEAHRIATIGDPEIRMREDPVRALRAVRFASRLGFTVAPDTFAAMRRHAGELSRCAPARVLEETFKILRCGGSARAFELLRACGALGVILPALGVALESWDEPKRRSFYAHLGALDAMVRAGEDVSDAVLLGTLIVHLPVEKDGQRTEGEALLTSLVQTSRLPRKIAERTRLALKAQRSLEKPGRRKRRGHGGQEGSLRDDAIPLLKISVTATGEGKESLERLLTSNHPEGDPLSAKATPREKAPVQGHPGRALARESAKTAEEDEALVIEVTDEQKVAQGPSSNPSEKAPGNRRKRRRGGRRRRRRGQGAHPSGGSSPEA